MSFGITELIIILVIVVLLFGTTKLKSLGTDLGSAIKGFRSAVTDEPADKADSDDSQASSAEAQVEKKETESTGS